MPSPAPISVLIVGAGPVGLALANDLGCRGIDCRILERERSPTALPKMNFVNVRSMELCRRWGLAEDVRRAGWPEDHPLDVAYVTSLSGHEITRFRYPAQRDKALSYSPETSWRCPQIWFDPILERGLARFECVELLRGEECVDFETSEEGVRVRSRNTTSGHETEHEARFLVAADGPGSSVRQATGIGRESWGPVVPQMAIALRTTGFDAFVDHERAAFFWIIDDEGVRGLVTPTDGERLWRFNWNLRAGESPRNFDPKAAIDRLAGGRFEYEIVEVLPWQIRFTLAEHYRKEHVFLVGDAARTLSPTGGLGMNTGLGDAADLGWKLAAVISGWGGDRLLDSYDAERRAAGRLINEESLRNLGRVAAIPRQAGIAEDSEAGATARSEAGRILDEGDFRLEFENDGAALGLQYTTSPCLEEGDEAPAYDANRYESFCAVGCRAPHARLSGDRSTLDLYGRGFCLLRLGTDPPDPTPLEQAANAVGLPLETSRLHGAEIHALHGRKLVLIRPDGIVAWRADELPASPRALIDRVRGAPGLIQARARPTGPPAA